MRSCGATLRGQPTGQRASAALLLHAADEFFPRKIITTLALGFALAPNYPCLAQNNISHVPASIVVCIQFPPPPDSPELPPPSAMQEFVTLFLALLLLLAL